MSWNGRRVLVTGAGGFIGSHLCEALVRAGARVRAFVRYNARGSCGWLDASPLREDLDIHSGDVADRDSVVQAVRGTDTVFHLAALIGIPYSYVNPASYVRTNVEGTLNVLMAARDEGVERVAHTSTSEVYGTALRAPIAEDHPLRGQSPYSASKIGADKMAEAFHLSFGLPVVTVRPFNTFGPRQSARAVIPTIVTQCLAGSDVRLGNLTPTRDLNYVTDVAHGFMLAADCPAAVGRTVNLGSGREISIGDLAATIIGLTGAEARVVGRDEARARPEGSEVERLLADASLARELFDYRPAHSLEQGLEHTIAWIREHMAAYRPGEYTV